MKALGQTDTGRYFTLGHGNVACLRNAASLGLHRELPFMLQGWLDGHIFDGMTLRADMPYRDVADMHERFPQITIEIPSR